jgi:hypothetical protein
MKAAWGLHSSHGYGLCEVKMPSEKMCWMRSFGGAECVLGGKPDAQIPELDEPRAVRPPEKTELGNSEETESSMWLFCLHSHIVISGHVASLV